MALPKQVEAELREIEELEKQLAAQENPPEAQEEAAPEQENEPETAEIETETETSEVVEPEVATPADPPVAEVQDDFKQKYNTLRGKYDAEVPRLHGQVKELSEQLDMFRKELEAAKQKESEKPKEKVSYVTDADREEFGEDLLDVQRRVAREVASEYEDRFKAQEKLISDLKDQISNTGTQIGEMSFSQRLHQLVPDFDTVDNDTRWVNWLDEYDPMVRGPRRDAALKAFNAGDAEAVAHYVNLWKKSVEVVPPKPAEANKARQTELEKQVTPTRSNSQPVSTESNSTGKVYTASEMERAWDKVRVLNGRGQYDDAAKLEAELTVAYMEGRVK